MIAGQILAAATAVYADTTSNIGYNKTIPIVELG